MARFISELNRDI